MTNWSRLHEGWGVERHLINVSSSRPAQKPVEMATTLVAVAVPSEPRKRFRVPFVGLQASPARSHHRSSPR
jgi:hypothetical protein